MRVQERTAALEAANQALQVEIAERQTNELTLGNPPDELEDQLGRRGVLRGGQRGEIVTRGRCWSPTRCTRPACFPTCWP